jgi:hypothetical protein
MMPAVGKAADATELIAAVFPSTISTLRGEARRQLAFSPIGVANGDVSLALLK